MSSQQAFLDNWESVAAPLIKSFEACRLKAYHGAKDRPGLYTVGWGSTGPDVTENTIWTQEQADARFLQDLRKFGSGVDDLVVVSLNDNEKAACVSFAYNLGLGALGRSTLLKKLNACDMAGCAKEFLKWDYADGEAHVPGLVRRRKAEMGLFMKEVK